MRLRDEDAKRCDDSSGELHVVLVVVGCCCFVACVTDAIKVSPVLDTFEDVVGSI